MKAAITAALGTNVHDQTRWTTTTRPFRRWTTYADLRASRLETTIATATRPEITVTLRITVTLAYLPIMHSDAPEFGAIHGPHRPVRRSELPHHVTQRGNRRERVFFSDADYELYRDLLREACSRERSRYRAVA